MAASGFNPEMLKMSLGAGAGAGVGAGLGGLMADWRNPADTGMSYLNQAPALIQKYLNPYVQAGQQALPGLQSQYGQLINDPGGRLNQIGAGYHQSPGFQFALQQALQGAGHAAAAGGMAGSPEHEQQNMGLATSLANQDYNQWLGNALGMFREGLAGQQGLYDTGAKTGVQMGEDLASILANQSKMAYEGQNAENEREGGIWGSLGGGLGTAAALAAFL